VLKVSRFSSAIWGVFTRVNMSLAVISGILLFLFMFQVVCDVTGRYLFLKPVPGTVETGEIVLVFAISLTLAEVMRRGEHIRITMFLGRLSPQWQAWLNMIALVAGFSLLVLMCRQSLLYAIRSYSLNEASPIFSVPIWPAKFALFAGCVLLCLQLLGQLFSQIFLKLGNISFRS
jgi:TRAP-type C4-dicarboxylate transport system permease small subunit